MPKFKNVLIAAAGLTLTAGGVMATASPASADEWAEVKNQWGATQAHAYFREAGDKLRVCDSAADGYGAIGRVYTPHNRKTIYRWSGGKAGTCTWHDLEIKERVYFKVQACVGNGGVAYCGAELTGFNDH